VSDRDRLVADRFRLIRRLGAGAMASVFLAEDCELGRRVAIKRLHPEPTSPEIGPRFRREMRVAASLSHPNVVTLYDAIEDDGDVLLIMELVDGPTLAQRMSGGPLEPDEAMRILRAIAAAVDHLHARGVIHRDIKPANILIDGSGNAKLTDLGIASAAEATGITTSGTILGTPSYMAPELFDGKRATRAADVYSVAAIAFEMLTGRRARGGGTPAVIAMRAATEPPPDLRELWPDAGALAEVLERGMARDPAERPESATALVDAIAAALRERELPPTEPIAADRAPAPAPQRTAEVPLEPGARDEDGATSGEPVAPVAPPSERSDPPEPVEAPTAAGLGRGGGGRRRGERRGPAVLLLGAAALAVAAIAAVLIATTGGGGGSDPRSASTPSHTTSTRTTKRDRTTSTSSSSTESPSTQSTSTQSTSTAPPQRAAAASPGTPAGAVQAFYGRAAAHRYDDAWSLAAPSLRSQLGGFGAFQRQFSTVRSIVFGRASTIRRSDSGATVAIATTATHTDHVDECTGSVDTAPASGGGWVVAHLNVNCRRATSAG
jgi:serine/threonine-protein kinase